MLACTEIALRGGGLGRSTNSWCKSPLAGLLMPSREFARVRDTGNCWPLYSRRLIAVGLLNANRSAPTDMINVNPPDPRPNEWAVDVSTAIIELSVPEGIDINAINPGLVTNHTSEMLDAEYARWLPQLAGPNRKPPRQRSGGPRVRTGLPVRNARARRRTAYARTQRSFRLSGKRCARDVLSGT